MFMKLVDYVFSHQSSFARYMPKSCFDLYEWINEVTPKLKDKKYKLNTKVHWILMGLTDFPKCANLNCTNKVGEDYNVVWSRGYVPYCCLKCGIQDSRDKCNDTLHKHAEENPDFFYEIEQKKKMTRLVNHHDPNWNNREQAVSTCIERYGCEHPLGNKDVLAKSLRTREKKYGKGNLTNYKKTAQTCLRLYGHRSVWGNPEIHKKCIDKTIELYGSPNPGNKYELDGFKFDSKPELAFYIWLRDNKIDFTYKPDIVFKYSLNNVIHRYFPDFIVDRVVTEIKGDHFFKEDGTMQNPFCHELDDEMEAKHQCMLANNVKIITSSEYNKYLSYVEEKYGKDYLNSLKKNKDKD